MTGAPGVFINNSPIMRTGDSVASSGIPATITTGARSVYIGNHHVPQVVPKPKLHVRVWRDHEEIFTALEIVVINPLGETVFSGATDSRGELIVPDFSWGAFEVRMQNGRRLGIR